MRLRTKLLAGFAGIFLPVAVLCVGAISSLQATDANTTKLYHDRLAPTIGLSQVAENLDQMRQLMAQYVLRICTGRLAKPHPASWP